MKPGSIFQVGSAVGHPGLLLGQNVNRVRSFSKFMVLLSLAIFALLSFPRISGQGAVLATPTPTPPSWLSSITYLNPTQDSGTMHLSYYLNNPTPFATAVATLNAYPSGSKVSTVGSAHWIGSGRADANTFLSSAYVQYVYPNTDAYARIVTRGLDGAYLGTTVYLPSILKKATYSSWIFVQNVEDFAIDVTVRLYSPSGSEVYSQTVNNLAVNASAVISLEDIPDNTIPNNWSGTAVVKGSKSNALIPTPARLGVYVLDVQQQTEDSRRAYGYEGIAQNGSLKRVTVSGQIVNRYYLFMPSAMCNLNGQTSYLIVMNTSATSSANVRFLYYDTGSQSWSSGELTVMPLGRITHTPCDISALQGATGSAVIYSTDQPIVAIGKIRADNWISTSYVGQGYGHTQVALSYVRWDDSPSGGWRTYIAVQNVGNATTNDVTVHYYNADGTLAGTHSLGSIGVYRKKSSNPSSAGITSDWAGAAIIISSQPVVVIARQQREVTVEGTPHVFGEDYNGSCITCVSP